MRFKLRFAVLILSLCIVSFAYSADGNGDEASKFLRKLESLMPSMADWRLDELHQIRQEVTPLEYVGICEYYAREYHDLKYDETAIKLSTDSIIMEGVDRILKEHCFTDKSVPYILMRCATRLYETGYPEDAALFAAVGAEVALKQRNGGYVYGELRCLESDLNAESNPEESLLVRLRMLDAFKSEYNRNPIEYTYERYLRNLIKTSELALLIDNVEIADSILQESLDLVYGRKNHDVVNGKVSMIIPTSSYRHRLSALESDIALKKGDAEKALDIQESLLWRYYECWASRNLSAHDYISYFNAIDALLKAKRFDKRNYINLIQASKIIKDWISGLSIKASPRLRNSYYTSARSLIQRINSVLVDYKDAEDVNETIYNNVLLFKNLQLQVNRALLLNINDDPRLDFQNYKNDFENSIRTAVLRTMFDYLCKQWRLERDALEGSDFRRWIKCDWNAVCLSLPSNCIAIEFFTTQHNGIETYYAAIANGRLNTPKVVRIFDESAIPDLGSDRLYRDKSFSKKIWGKLQKYITPDCILYYSPEGQLYNIALEHLQSLNGKNLCMADINRILRVSTTRELVMENSQKNEQMRKMAFFSNIDYDNTTDDINTDRINEKRAYNRGSLISILKTQGKFARLGKSNDGGYIRRLAEANGIRFDSYKEASASIEAFQRLSDNNYDLLHLSTHGFYIPVDSIHHSTDYKRLPFVKFYPGITAEDLSMNCCGLALSGANRIFEKDTTAKLKTGILTASEISTLNLSKINFIFLSACQTGLGYISSDGVYGLQRGFKTAGVKSMIYTLWDVNNDACEMFEREFYTNYFGGKSKYDSFVAARNKLRSFTGVYNDHSYDFSQPKYWAGFVLLDGF